MHNGMRKGRDGTVDEPLVSIGLAVRNGAPYLREALDTLLHQTHKNFELIISDNASTDDTQKICKEYTRRDQRIRYIRQKEDIGGYRNYDFVRKEAREDYFMWATHDDRWDRRFIEKCLARLHEDSEAIVAFSNFDAFFDSGERIPHPSRQYLPFQEDLYTRLKAYLQLKSSQGKIEMIYGLWKRSVLKDMYSRGEFHSDDTFVFEMLFEGHFAFVDEVLFMKRASPGFQRVPHITKELLMKKLKAFVLFFFDRLRAVRVKFFYAYCKDIFCSAGLTRSEKIRLFGWALYAYLRSIWYGHM